MNGWNLGSASGEAGRPAVGAARMTKRDLVTRISNEMGLTQTSVKEVVDRVLKHISDSLADGDSVELRNFGVFTTRLRNSRVGRNPRTGERIPIPPRRVVTFKPSKSMAKRIESLDL